MFTTKSSILCVFLYMGVVTADANVIFNKTQKVSGHVASISILNSRLSVVRCGEPVEDPESIQNCLITQTTLESQSKLISCTLKFYYFLKDINVYPLTDNKAILFTQTWDTADDGINFVSIFNFSDCTLDETVIKFESYDAAEKNFQENGVAILINDDGTFDVLYNDVKLCSNKICKLSFNAQGRKVKGPIASFVPLVGAFRTRKKLPGSSSFIVTELKLGKAYRISLIMPDEQVMLKEFNTYDDFHDFDVSTSRGLIRICSKTNTTKVDCELFDYLSGKSTAKMSVVAPQRVGTIAVENLSDGKFVLLGETEEAGSLMKVNGDGSLVGVIELSRFACNFGHEIILMLLMKSTV